MLKIIRQLFPSKSLPFSIFFNPDCFLHDTGPSHPEQSQRLQAIIDGCLAINSKDSIDFRYPRSATITDLTILYSQEYLMRLEEACLRKKGYFMSMDNPICFDSFKAILAAGGLALELGRNLISRRCGFALTRPPGHHAGIDKAEGFCFINHIGLAIEQIRLSDPNGRILVVDFDVHHGNGTCDIYRKDDKVFFYSIHGIPENLYPGTGFKHDQGEEIGEGHTLNVPLSIGTRGDIWLTTFQSNLEKSAARCNPQYILVSAGFDAHVDDPFALMKVEDEHYLKAITALTEATQRFCPGRLGLVLEGGYSLSVLGRLIPKIIVNLSTYYNRLPK